MKRGPDELAMKNALGPFVFTPRPRLNWMRPLWYWSAAALLILGILVAIAFQWITSAQVQDLRLEVVKLALQLAIVGIVGGLIKNAVDERKALTQFRVEVLAELGKAHAVVYSLRRELALRGNDPELVRRLIFELMRLRNDLGNVGHHARVRLDDRQHDVIANIDSIREWLEELIDEAVAEARHGEVQMGSKLRMFIAGCRGEPDEAEVYLRRFKAPYVRAKLAADPSWAPSPEQLRIASLSATPTPDHGSSHSAAGEVSSMSQNVEPFSEM